MRKSTVSYSNLYVENVNSICIYGVIKLKWVMLFCYLLNTVLYTVLNSEGTFFYEFYIRVSVPELYIDLFAIKIVKW